LLGLAILPPLAHSFPVAGVAMVEVSDIKATRDFLFVWQRGRTAKSLRAPAATAKSCEPGSRENC
jgi:hypothetical protein